MDLWLEFDEKLSGLILYNTHAKSSLFNVLNQYLSSLAVPAVTRVGRLKLEEALCALRVFTRNANLSFSQIT